MGLWWADQEWWDVGLLASWLAGGPMCVGIRVTDGSSQWRLWPADSVTLRLLPGSADLYISSGSRVLLDESTI